MSNLKYHGLVILNENKGQLRFGIVELINVRSSLSWISVEDKSEAELKAIKRFDNRAYWQCAIKCREIAFKLDMALHKLSNSLSIVEEQDKYAYDGAPLETAAIYYQASEEIPYHLDAFIAYLRILADCISFALPFFYDTKQKNIANDSFRRHIKWFMEKCPGFDPEYTKILKEHSKWFELLAGKNEQGIRDRNFHHFATYQMRGIVLPNGRHQIYISQVTSKGIVTQDLLSTLEEMICDFFEYLDNVYELFGNRFKSEIPSRNWGLEEKSVLMNLEMSDIRLKYRLYPIINTN